MTPEIRALKADIIELEAELAQIDTHRKRATRANLGYAVTAVVLVGGGVALKLPILLLLTLPLAAVYLYHRVTAAQDGMNTTNRAAIVGLIARKRAEVATATENYITNPNPYQ